MAAIKVLSSSADTAFRSTLCAAIAGDEQFALTDCAWNDAEHLYALILTSGANVVLLDESCAAPGGLMKRMHFELIPVRFIVVVEECGHDKLADLIRSGVRGCIQKNAPPGLWRKAIHAVHDGDIWVNRSVVLDLLEVLVDGHAHGRPAEQSIPDGRLTEREWEVARLVASGMTNKEVARFMKISDTTVKTHLKHIFGKLKVKRRGQLPRLEH